MENLCVRDLMTQEVICIGANEDAGTLYELMSQHQIRHVPVIDSSGDLVGVVTHRDFVANTTDIANGLPVGERRELLRNILVGELMTSVPETIEADDEITEAARTMLENKLGCLPVVQGSRLVGILTESDFVRWVLDREMQRERRGQVIEGIRRARAV